MKIKYLIPFFILIVISFGFNTQSVFADGVWTEQTDAGVKVWDDIASSSDGTKLVAVVGGGISNDYVWTSVDSGVTWDYQINSGSRVWSAVASSDDGLSLVATVGAVPNGGYIYTSTDGGANWTERTGAGQRLWSDVASSDDGLSLAATDRTSGSGYIYTSTDGGVNWTERTGAGQRQWTSISSSSDGLKLVAVNGSGGYIYTSTDGGANWTERTGAGSQTWSAVSSSSDGSKLVATTDVMDSYIFTSIDSGITWTQRLFAGEGNTWSSVASSGDGSIIIAARQSGVIQGDYLYISTDSGVTWTEQTGAGAHVWNSVASSSDGAKLFAVVGGAFGGYIYTYAETVAPALSSSTTKYSFPPLCTTQFTPSTITKGEPTTLSWNITWQLPEPNTHSNYYVKIPTQGIYGSNTNSITLTPSNTTTYQLASINLFGANFCEATITVLDDTGTELIANSRDSYLTANTIKSPLGSIILDFFKRLFHIK